ncbi:invasion associated locus B family protein [Bartonella sp. HY406]|uniref:invasion associated locus B family protein n=1 Tax=Bartonella sp. HY406 TaxID=2979331 RepID=UPI0021C60CCF|nr:invasion associated locus B family protein [Bartonella sp. HY406]UXN02333.1 invasion associated locus B family protein [Bartonella sp. HY406]
MPIAKTLTTLSLFASAAALLAAFVVPASAQSAMDGWNKVCSEQQNAEKKKVSVCNTMNNIVSETGQYLTMINLIEVKEGGKSQKRIGIQVPTGRLIPAGITVKVDGNAEKTIPYMICNGPTCIANDSLSDELVAQLKKGTKLVVTSVNFQGAPNPLEVSLAGFAKVFDGPGMREQDFQAEQEKLQKAIQDKQQEQDDKMREAQEKAKNAQ